MTGGQSDKAEYSFTVLPDTRIAVFRWVGRMTIEDRRQMRGEMVAYCQSQDVSDLIVDGREQISDTSTIESYQFGAEVPDTMRGLRIAVVHRSDDSSLPFIETVANNRGSNTRAFTTIESAREWLESTD